MLGPATVTIAPDPDLAAADPGAMQDAAGRLSGMAGRLVGLSGDVDAASDPQWSGRWSGQATSDRGPDAPTGEGGAGEGEAAP